MPTEYRIIQFKTDFGNSYLQFKYVKKLNIPFLGTFELVRWYFVPNKIDVFSQGKFLSQEKCPTLFQLKYIFKKRYKLFFKSEFGISDNLIRFQRNYPDIENYFIKIRAEREHYLSEKNKSKCNPK